MKKSYLKFALGVGIAATGLVLLDALFLERYFFEIKRFKIGKSKSKKKVRILLLTDLHFVKHFNTFQRRLARKINELNPEMILVAGDTIDQDGKPGPARAFFSMVNKAIPKFAILGNHDHVNKVSIDTLRSIYEENNGHLLVNETKQLQVNGARFTITGLDDFMEGESCVADAVRNVGKEEHHLLLVHSPLQQVSAMKDLEIINKERAENEQVTIQYIFAGHNHGGQVTFGGIVPKLPEGAGGYINGWYNDKKPYLYLSKGFGTSVVRLRFGARAEITLFNYGV
jgi:predicted MPP superfamily phosphohydrolase